MHMKTFHITVLVMMTTHQHHWCTVLIHYYRCASWEVPRLGQLYQGLGSWEDLVLFLPELGVGAPGAARPRVGSLSGERFCKIVSLLLAMVGSMWFDWSRWQGGAGIAVAQGSGEDGFVAPPKVVLIPPLLFHGGIRNYLFVTDRPQQWDWC